MREGLHLNSMASPGYQSKPPRANHVVHTQRNMNGPRAAGIARHVRLKTRLGTTKRGVSTCLEKEPDYRVRVGVALYQL